MNRIETCTSVEQCLDIISTGDTHDSSLDNLDYVVKLVIHRMYCCGDMNMRVLKDVFLKEPLSRSAVDFSVENMIKNWEENVGSLGMSLPRSSPGLVPFISRLSYLTLPALQTAFVENVRNHEGLVGIMDLMFFVSGFDTARRRDMGGMFWLFAKHVIQLEVADSDRLNLLLYGRVLPQTIICMTDTEYILDALIPVIACDISIRGFQTCNDQGAVVTRTLLTLRSELSFSQDVDIDTVNIRSVRPSLVKFSLDFTGDFDKPVYQQVALKNLGILGGGIQCQNLKVFQMLDVSVRNCSIGLYLNNVEYCFIYSTRNMVSPNRLASFKHCESALYLCMVRHVDVRSYLFCNCKEVLDGLVHGSLEMTNNTMWRVGRVGSVWMPEGKAVISSGNKVCCRGISYCFGGSHPIFLLLFRLTSWGFPWMTPTGLIRTCSLRGGRHTIAALCMRLGLWSRD